MQPGKRRIRNPAGLGEFTDTQRQVDQQHACDQQPEAQGVQERERHVASADLQRQNDVHQAREERHRHEDDHDHTVSGEDLVIVLRRKEPFSTVLGHRQLGTHHDRVGKTAQQHDHGNDDVHHADFLVVDRGQPLRPQVRPLAEIGDQPDNRNAAERDHGKCHHDYGLVERHRFQT